MTEKRKLIEKLLGDVLYLENIIEDGYRLNNYDCDLMLDITKDIYDVIRILKTVKGANNDAERERLIGLLKSDSCQSPMICDPNCKYANLERCYEERVADYLLENGVIVLPYKI